jgi:hypothetical protein
MTKDFFLKPFLTMIFRKTKRTNYLHKINWMRQEKWDKIKKIQKFSTDFKFWFLKKLLNYKKRKVL